MNAKAPPKCVETLPARSGYRPSQRERRDVSAGRDVTELDKVLVHGSSPKYPLTSVDAFVDWAGRHTELGLTELVLHWPVPDSVYASDAAVFEKIATEGLPQLRE